MGKEQRLQVLTRNVGHKLNDLYGIFYEDLNHAADGGLYAELIQNRSFEFDPIDNSQYHSLTGWEKVERGHKKVDLGVETSQPLNPKNSHYLVLDVQGNDGVAGIMNLGFSSGISLKKEEEYFFSCYARLAKDEHKEISIALESRGGKVYHQQRLKIDSTKWKKYKLTFTATETDPCGRLVITTEAVGLLHLDMVSLFPKSTYKNRPNGLRRDIVEYLEALKPKFLRFPGGCLIHDGSLNSDDRDSMYRWKNTIGPIEEHPTVRNNWGYNQTLGLGYYEYFQLAEDIGAKPIPILPAGYNPHRQEAVPIEELQPWIDDALDLIEFANGDMTTKWGSVRAELGHPEPFDLEYIGIGNEEVGAAFFDRYDYFHQAIKEKHPEIKIINSSGPFAAGSEYDRGWASARKNNSDFVDEHYYQSPEWMLAHYHRYDHFDPTGPKVFLGEYASKGNTFYNALVEAAYMTGLEKNSAVGLACYAPLLCHADYVNWQPNLIWFNNHQVYPTANYFTQQLFMNHQGEYALETSLEGFNWDQTPENKPITGKAMIETNQINGEFYDLKIINKKTGVEKHYSSIKLNGIEKSEIDDVEWTDYQISFKMKKLSGDLGFKLYFGHEDEKNQLFWEIGGWLNQDSLIGADVNGMNSCLTQSIFTLEPDKEYQFDLHISGRTILTYINGNLMNETEDVLPVIEPLYYTASLDKSKGDVLVKVVNVQDVPVKTKVELVGITKDKLESTIYELSGHALNDQNSFEYPEKIKPKQKMIVIEDQVVDYEFAQHSVTVFRIHQAL
ncbi:carbohydrate binding domain-containing protein [Amphibacillus sp. MSJ-3]|uniref:alpha-L-arabinofuranosidase C-terminal domain-containing protein n=1 Tax=Amphibacillus sp. MSJ-3 TaxID=2841505 RepID=UPI001C0F1480|nr:alpha-L-arabinofuranosidase C-terminal domain-containing protein [Amphibacillus sp. MSJ-3]MBU5595534.1 carbohydrate binding domain-containing protein [Amphibacillus sp. MSJ-3]